MKKQPAGLLEKLLKNREQEGVSIERHMDIDVHDLVPNPQNFYSMRNIDRLKNLIKTTGKVEELTVKSVGKGKYMVVAGHRRRKAVLELVEEGAAISSKVPCSVVSFKPVGNRSAEDMELLWLSSSNMGQREYRTMSEKIQEVELISRLLRKDYDEDYAGGFVTGAFRSYLAQFLCMTDSRLQRLLAMRNVVPDYLEMIDSGELKETAAYELTNLSEEEQHILMDAMEGQEITVKGIKQKKDELFAKGQTTEADVNSEGDGDGQLEKGVADYGAADESVAGAAEETVNNVVPDPLADAGGDVAAHRTADKSRLMTSVDMLMSYCEGRHDTSTNPCPGCDFEDGQGGCRMGTKPCVWHIESAARKTLLAC
ncbi:ParB/RepB/Spo0J family partition protein [Selenomonas ruminantium]|nr:ParB/RepB/Spo0J family partition protein [Selenomonas ruminantium]